MHRRSIIVITLVLVLAGSLSPMCLHNPPNTGVQSPSSATPRPTAGSAQNYEVKIVENGLSSGTQWSVGAYEAPPNESYPVALQKTSTNISISFSLPPGSYSFEGYVNGPFIEKEQYALGTVVNSSIVVNMYFEELFNISVTEHGLPYGMNWGVEATSTTDQNNNGGHSGPPFNTTFSLAFKNGTYEVKAGMMLSAYAWTPAYWGILGNVTIDGSPVNLTADFYTVNITALNLPAGTPWGLPYLQNYLYPGSRANMTLFLLDGSYDVRPVATGYYSNGVHVRVAGGAVSYTTTFEKEFPVVFVEHNLSSDFSQWMIDGLLSTYNGIPSQFNTSTLTYMQPNGSYSFTVMPSGHYRMYIGTKLYDVDVTAHVNESSFTVSGKSVMINVTFNTTYTLVPAPVSNPPPGSPDYTIYYVIAAIVSASSVVSGLSLYFYRKKKEKP